MTTRRYLTVVACLCLIAGCSSSSPTKPLPTPGAVVFSDRFADRAGAWEEMSDAFAKVTYLPDGGIGVQLLRRAHAHVYTNKMAQRRDVYVEVEYDITTTSQGAVGPTCRLNPRFNGVFYSFQISTDGAFGIWRYKGGGKELASGQRRDSLRSPAKLRVGAFCVGGPDGVALGLLVNDELLLHIVDRDSPIVDAGLATFFANGLEGPVTRIISFVLRDAAPV